MTAIRHRPLEGPGTGGYSIVAALCLALGGASVVRAQPQLNPVYVDDAPAAAETLSRVNDHLAAGNVDEAVRVLQALLDDHADRLTPSADDPDVFVGVRQRVHEVLLKDAGLLRRYRSLQGPRAAAELELAGNAFDGPIDQLHRSLMLTPAGLEAALRVAQRQLEDARFEAARLTLEELELHPDRTGPAATSAAARDAASLLAIVARYVDRPEVWARAERWAGASGADPASIDRSVEAAPPGAGVPALSPLVSLPELDTRGLISKPLWSIEIVPATTPGPEQPMGGFPGGGPAARGMASVPRDARDLMMLPSVTDDLLVINDGGQVTAWDRFTLSTRWTIQPGPGTDAEPDENERDMWRAGVWGPAGGPEPITVTIVGRDGAAATGRMPSANKDGDDRIHGLDPRTGRLRWSVSLGQLDPSLANSSVRGPLEIVEGTVVAAIRKHAPDRRLMSLSMVGLDAATGRLRWLRLLGSAGWLPFGPQITGPEATLVHAGVAYRTDELGAVAAVAIDSGRTLWVRRMPVEAGAAMRETPRAWELNRPIMDSGSLVIITPDQRRLARLDATTGDVLGERPSGMFGSPVPTYLLKIGPQLAAIGPNRIALTPIAAFETAPIRLTPQIEDPGIWGRISVVGDKLLVPLVKGLALLDATRPDADPLVQPLDRPGNVLAVGKQLLVVNDSQAHSYLQWEVAESILTERIAADARDPTAAVTFAELAYRAGRFDRIVPSIDTALRAIAAEPSSERNLGQRRRLFETVHDMVTAALEPADPAGSRPAGAGAVPATDPIAEQSILPPEAPGNRRRRIADRPLIAMLIDKLDKAADTADDRVSVALASGRLAELSNDAARAAGVYQRVLDEPTLAAANWRGPSVSVRAELEATRRLEQLIAQRGPEIYMAQEAECARRLAEIGENGTAEQFEQLAARFPLSTHTPDVYRRLSEVYRKDGSLRKSIAALENGLKAAQRVPGAPDSAVGELAGRLILDLRERHQSAAAASVLRNVRRRSPTLALTAFGQVLDADRLGAELAERLARSMRWPRIGTLTGENVQLINNWFLLKPHLADPTPHMESCLVMQSDREVAVWVVEREGERAGQFGKMWSRTIDDLDVQLIRSTPEAVYVWLESERTGGIERVPLTPDAKGWRTEPLGKLFPAGDDTRGFNRAPGVLADAFETPDDGPVLSDRFIAAMDDRTLAMVQRGGRALALDCETGEVLWQANTGVSQVYDAQLVGGTLVIAGEVRKMNATGGVEELLPAVQVIDARTGRMGQRIGSFDTRVRWVRLTESGQLICGTEKSVVSLDVNSAQRNWTLASGEVLPAAAAWIFGDRLLLLSADRQLWLASVSTGRLRPQSLEAPRARMESSREVDAYLVSSNPDGPFAVATYQGVMIFSADGELQGIDGLGAIDTMLPPRPAEGRTVAIETTPDARTADGLMQFQMYLLESAGGMLESRHTVLLGARPNAMQLLDGKVVISAGTATMIIEAPMRK